MNKLIIPAVFVVISKTSLFNCQSSYYSLLQGCFCYNKRFSRAKLKIKRGTGEVCVVFNSTSSQTQIPISLFTATTIVAAVLAIVFHLITSYFLSILGGHCVCELKKKKRKELGESQAPMAHKGFTIFSLNIFYPI